MDLVSMVILATTPKPAELQRPDDKDLLSLNELVAAFIDVQVPETTALLAVLGELVDDDVLRDRCRRAVDARNDTTKLVSGPGDVPAGGIGLLAGLPRPGTVARPAHARG